MKNRVYLTPRNKDFFESIEADEQSECVKCGYIGKDRASSSDGFSTVYLCPKCGNDAFYSFKILEDQNEMGTNTTRR